MTKHQHWGFVSWGYFSEVVTEDCYEDECSPENQPVEQWIDDDD